MKVDIPDDLFLDNILSSTRKGLPSSPRNPDEEMRTNLLTRINRSHPIYIPQRIAQRLYEIPHDPLNPEEIFQLPSRILYFEFSEPLLVQKVEGEEPLNLKAILYGVSKDASPFAEMIGESADMEGSLFAALFYQTPTGTLVSQDLLHIDPEEIGRMQPTSLTMADINGQEVDQTLNVNHYGRIPNLCANLVDYIKAANQTKRRKERNPKDLAKINRKRRKKGKKPIHPLKPIHWIETKPTTTQGNKRPGTGTPMDYQEPVIGHFQKYHTGPRDKSKVIKNWIDEYNRGPEDAPFKKNGHYIKDKTA